jgi:hypothetical protein
MKMTASFNTRELDYLLSQIAAIESSLKGSFPYDDCRVILKQMHGTEVRKSDVFQDLIPDLDTYLDGVESYSSGAEELLKWDASKLSFAQTWLRRSFYQTHTKYKRIEWMINQVNTPRLYAMLSASDQLRGLLKELISNLLFEMSQHNRLRQDEFLTAA